jgi:hypothetical protein
MDAVGRNRGGEPARSGTRARRRGGPGPQGARVVGPLLPGFGGGEASGRGLHPADRGALGELASLEARRSELAEEISEQPGVPGPAELVEFVGDIERALSDGALPERKAVMQGVVAEIRVRDRGHIQPVFRVPIFGPPYGSVPPAGIEPATRGLGIRFGPTPDLGGRLELAL